MSARNTPHVNKKEYREMQKHPYSLYELLGFYRACYAVYRQIIHRRPTVIIAPLRGAEPILKTIHLIASLERKSSLMPPVMYPRTGEQSDLDNGLVFDTIPARFRESMTHAQKKKELTDMLGQVMSSVKRQKPVRVMLIDEAFSGGSISEHFSLLDGIIRERNWNASLFGASVTTKRTPKSKVYSRLLWEGRIKQYDVPWLFTTDSMKFLFPLSGKRKKILHFLLGKSISRPGLVLSREAMVWRHILLSDIEKLWEFGLRDNITGKMLRVMKGKRKIARMRRMPLHKSR
ncbi:MAG: hypothetical protein V1776_01960 [Candidatus Diapherotrites archaeon]